MKEVGGKRKRDKEKERQALVIWTWRKLLHNLSIMGKGKNVGQD